MARARLREEGWADSEDDGTAALAAALDQDLRPAEERDAPPTLRMHLSHLDALRGTGVLAIDADDEQTCAVLEGGGVACWAATVHRASWDEEATDLALLSGAGCVLIGGGRIRCWRGPVETAVLQAPLAGVEGARSLAMGLEGPCAVDAAGALVCPPSAPEPGLPPLASVASDGFSTCLRTEGRGEVLCRGWMLDHVWREEYAPVPDVTAAVDLDVGASNACSALADGRVTCWGSGWLSRAAVTGITSAVQVAVNRDWVCARERTGRVVCWNPLGTRTIPGLEAATDLAVGAHRGCAVLADGRVRCWGQVGWLGNGERSHYEDPVDVLPPGSG